MTVHVVGVSGPQAGQTFVVSRFPAIIGRGGVADIRLGDDPERPTLSRRHVELSYSGATLRCRDLSRNGTTIDGQRLPLRIPVPLREGAELRLGPNHCVRIERVDAKPRLAPTFDELCRLECLQQAWRKVALNRGVHGIDRVSIEEFAESADSSLRTLSRLLSKGRYQSLPARIVSIPKRSGAGSRRLSILAIRDRVLQQALSSLLRPHFEPGFQDCSYGYRTGISAHNALRAVDTLLSEGKTWVLDADIEAFFDNVSHSRLLSLLDPVLEDERLRTLVRSLLVVGEFAPGLGLAQGAATSPLYSNVYLDQFDRFAGEQGMDLVRYSDDWVVLSPTREQSESHLLECEQFLRERLELRLRPDKTRVVSLEAGFIFLGYRFDTRGRGPAEQAIERLQERLKGLPEGSAAARQVLAGWRGYYGDPVAVPLQAKSELDLPSRYLEIFRGREDIHAVQWCGPGRRQGYLPRKEPLTPKLLARHLDGRETLGLYLLRRDQVCILAFDIDAPRATEPTPHTYRLAWDLALEGRRFGIPTWVEESGGKGLHVWIFFSKFAAAKTVRKLGRLLAARVGIPRPGTTLEIFPREDEASGLGSMLKLPAGIHQATGRRSRWLGPDGEAWPLETFLTRVQSFPVSGLSRLLSRLEAIDPQRPELFEGCRHANPVGENAESGSVEQVLSRCRLLRELVARPAQTGHLVHTERLILMHTFGHLGEEGRRFVHRIIAGCDNYRAKVTQRWLDRLQPGRSPLGCNRLKEWLSELYGEVQCDCASARGPYRSPVFAVEGISSDSARASRRVKPKETKDEVAEAAWIDVQADLFGKER